MEHKEISVHAQFSALRYIDQYYHAYHSQCIHCHENELELLYIMTGTGQYIVDGRTWAVQGGNLIVCNAKILHGEAPLSANNMETYCCVLKDISMTGLSEYDFYQLTQNPIINFSEEREGFEHLLLTLDFLNAKGEAFAKARNLLAEAMLSIVCEKLQQRHQQDTILHKKVDDFVGMVIRYLETHYKEPITLGELGKKFHISHYYLSHIFKEQTGYSPMKYAAQLKIGESQKLLMNTDKSIGSIGEEIGFNDYCHFSVMFKRYTGLSPTEYRRYFKKRAAASEKQEKTYCRKKSAINSGKTAKTQHD